MELFCYISLIYKITDSKINKHTTRKKKTKTELSKENLNILFFLSNVYKSFNFLNKYMLNIIWIGSNESEYLGNIKKKENNPIFKK